VDSISVMEVIRFIHLNKGGIIIGESIERASEASSRVRLRTHPGERSKWSLVDTPGAHRWRAKTRMDLEIGHAPELALV
jgi:hypothetical protein